ncbi:hypothetical protein HT662_04795 [Ursidibacter maritimus]|uniref:Factor H binding protein-like C-terminal domain-containing protein n=1 Tax=Ursidibacter maritimus TaxID=1331689 RepID=A0A949T416_9PAST|nr:factor H binding protein domain-containing protein [Ursidibacter maritimus]KAE9538732.1 hypothetical protein A1D26_05505 [Ursidibacter maritimus]MBV6525971.1 hypothetical protein [Ursidibacter maritimus]MBV6537010.1 hypothetical protein [Ursidibacter maritimus]MBV6546287.1 hypothetical protein [Ursidibacter maritimus]
MSLMKATLASILLVSLTACSSGEKKGNNAQAEMPESKHTPKVITEEKKDTPKPISEEKKDMPKPISEEKKDMPKPISEEKKDMPKSISEEKKDMPKPISEEKKDMPKPISEEKKPTPDEELAQKIKKEILGKDYPQGLTRNPIVKEVLDNMKSYDVGSSIYNQKYSLLKIEYRSNSLANNDEGNFVNMPRDIGVKTNLADLPTSGNFSYKGVAIDMKGEGVLNYDINFSTKKGKGSVTGLPIGNVELQEAKIGHSFDMKGILFGDAKYSSGEGHYNLNLYGPAGEEVSGNMILNDKNNDLSKNYGLAGSRE